MKPVPKLNFGFFTF